MVADNTWAKTVAGSAGHEKHHAAEKPPSDVAESAALAIVRKELTKRLPDKEPSGHPASKREPVSRLKVSKLHASRRSNTLSISGGRPLVDHSGAEAETWGVTGGSNQVPRARPRMRLLERF